ncbi:MAG: MGMT family protein [Intestinimonas sp.]
MTGCMRSPGESPGSRAATYGQIALMTGSPRAARAVGYAMAACTDPAVPCHRILARDGAIREHAFGPGVQRALLEAEGCPLLRMGGWICPGAAGTGGKIPSNPCAFLRAVVHFWHRQFQPRRFLTPMIDFQLPRLSDKPWVDDLLRQANYRGCV